MTRISSLLLVLVLGIVAGAIALAGRDGSPSAATAEVAEVIDGDTVVLERPIGGARQVRLVGIQAPKLPLGRSGFRTWPLAPEAKKALEDLVLGRRVTLAFATTATDRHGRHLAHLTTEDGSWVQGEMLRRGMARVYTFPDNRDRAADMYALERAARDGARGIWGHWFYALRTPESAARDTGTFQVVEGRVVAAAKARKWIFLNFGPDWRTDFTVRISSAARRLFDAAGADPLSWKGRRIRVRGWLKRRDGPMIDATHPEQVELLAPGK